MESRAIDRSVPPFVSNVVLVHDDDDVHEEEQVAYVRLDAVKEEPLAYEM